MRKSTLLWTFSILVVIALIVFLMAKSEQTNTSAAAVAAAAKINTDIDTSAGEQAAEQPEDQAASDPEGQIYTSINATSTNDFGSTTNASGAAEAPGDNLTLGENSTSTLGMYLIGYNGMTLYAYSPDAAGVSKCTGQCAVEWPPYIVTSTSNLVAESPIAGAIGTLTRSDGSIQVTYNGEPLYFYSHDSVSGDITGNGLDSGAWHILKP